MRFNAVVLQVPSIFLNGVYGFKKNLVSCSTIQKHVFESVEFEEEKNDQVFPLCFQSCFQKKVSALAIWYMRGVRGGRLSCTRISAMVWSPSCYPNTNKQRRNIGVNDRGRGSEACLRAGWALQSPGALKSEGPVRITHTSSLSSERHFHACCCVSSKLLRLFPRLVTSLQTPETWELAAWFHESFMDLELGKLLAAFCWSSSVL